MGIRYAYRASAMEPTVQMIQLDQLIGQQCQNDLEFNPITGNLKGTIYEAKSNNNFYGSQIHLDVTMDAWPENRVAFLLYVSAWEAFKNPATLIKISQQLTKACNEINAIANAKEEE